MDKWESFHNTKQPCYPGSHIVASADGYSSGVYSAPITGSCKKQPYEIGYHMYDWEIVEDLVHCISQHPLYKTFCEKCLKNLLPREA